MAFMEKLMKVSVMINAILRIIIIHVEEFGLIQFMKLKKEWNHKCNVHLKKTVPIKLVIWLRNVIKMTIYALQTYMKK